MSRTEQLLMPDRRTVRFMEPNMTDLRTLLLIDNDPSHANIFREALPNVPDGPFECECVATLAEGIERLGGNDIWAIFLNLSLPDSHGSETFDRLSLAVPGIPTLVLGGVADENIALEALRRGAKDYLLEDHVDGYSFVRAIRNMAERHAVGEALFSERERPK
jgi:DNA-binding NarL/FixJ family response regulator